MRMITILAAGVTLAFAMAAQRAVHAGPRPSPGTAPAAAPEAPAAAPPSINSVSIVDIAELPETTQKQVNEVVTQRGDADLQKLRTQIDSMPQLKSALEAKGLTSAQVIAASMGADGALTLITKKAS